MTTALCQSKWCRPEDVGGPREVEAGRPLCRPCADRFGPYLRRLATMWPDLRARVAAAGGGGEPVSGTKTPGLVLNDHVVLLSHELERWTRRTVAGVLAGSPHAQAPRAASAGVLLAWLGKYHAWRLIYRGEPADVVERADWVAYFRSEVHRCAYPSSTRRVDVPGGRCRALVLQAADVDTGSILTRPCRGQLYALIRSDSPLPSEIVCEVSEDHRIPSDQWVQLSRQLEAESGGVVGRLPHGGGDREDPPDQRQVGP